jgi:hypothetical protein
MLAGEQGEPGRQDGENGNYNYRIFAKARSEARIRWVFGYNGGVTLREVPENAIKEESRVYHLKRDYPGRYR